MDPDDGAPDDGVPDGLNLGADVDQYNVPAPVVLPASGSTTAAPVQAVVRVDGAGGSRGSVGTASTSRTSYTCRCGRCR